ncbi:hypothetical protein ACE6H2_017292 [Prunus campanulata]
MGIFSKKQQSGFSASSTAEEVTEGIDGTGLTAIVTGASSGIGVETARVLALRGVHVVMAVRNTDAGANVKEVILKEIPNAKIDVRELDLSSFTSVRKFAADYHSSGLPLNILIYSRHCAYAQSKLANILHANKLSQCLKGAATTCFVALNPQVKGVGGEYFSDCKIAKQSSQAKDADMARRLWDCSLSLTNPKK